MPKHCFVPRCNSGYESEKKFCKKNNLKPATIFKAPSNPDMLEKWRRSIPRLDRTLSLSDGVCEKHFSGKFIERYYRIKLPNKVEYWIERGRVILLPDAVPTKFPNCPKYLSKASPKSRRPLIKHELTSTTLKMRKRKQVSTSMENNLDGILPLEEPCKNIPTHESDLTNSTLDKKSTSLEDNLDGLQLLPLKEVCKNIPTHENDVTNPTIDKKSVSLEDNLDGMLPLPLLEVDCKNISTQESPADHFTFDILQELDFQRNSWSKVVIKEKNLVKFVHQPSNLSKSMKYVNVLRNLTVKVILGNVITAFVNYEKIKDFDHLHKLLDLMETINLCPGTVSNRSYKCVGYLSGNNLSCIKCKRFKKQEKLED